MIYKKSIHFNIREDKILSRDLNDKLINISKENDTLLYRSLDEYIYILEYMIK